jgi:hypothetical protein
MSRVFMGRYTYQKSGFNVGINGVVVIESSQWKMRQNQRQHQSIRSEEKT